MVTVLSLVKSISMPPTLLLLAMTLRGPSGGHCVELHGEANLYRKQWAPRAHCLIALVFIELELKAPCSGSRRAPGGKQAEV